MWDTQVERKVSAHLRLAATALAGLLGAPRLAWQQFEALDIKHIQLDSVAGTPPSSQHPLASACVFHRSILTRCSQVQLEAHLLHVQCADCASNGACLPMLQPSSIILASSLAYMFTLESSDLLEISDARMRLV